MNRVYPDHPYRLSHSMLELFHTCERKFQLERLLVQGSTSSRNSASTVRGTAFGVGVQSYMVHGDIDRAIWECWLAYAPMMEDKPSISQARTINNLWQAKTELDKIKSRYRIVYFREKPAVELSFKLILDDKWYYAGAIDIVLYDTIDCVYVVWDVKTTAYRIHDLSPMYKNSGQLVGYSIVLDQIVGEQLAKYGVFYFVCRDHYADFVPDFYPFYFPKTLLDRLNWFLSLGYDYESIKRMDDFGIWPMRGQSCLHFGRPCHYFGTCNTTAGDIPKDGTVDTTEYDFVYKLDDVIADHLKRVNA